MPVDYHSITIRGAQLLPGDLTEWGVVITATREPGSIVRATIVGQTAPRSFMADLQYPIQRPIYTPEVPAE